MVIALLKRPQAVTLAEIAKATHWDPNSVRGFISKLGRQGLKVESSKRENGEREYRVAAQ